MRLTPVRKIELPNPTTLPSVMTAALVERYGPPEVVRITEVPVPNPGRGELLVQVRAAAVTAGDARIRGARFPKGFAPFARLAFGLRRPRRPILGGTFSGTVAALGPDVTGFAVGDEVAGMTGVRLGTHAGYAVVKAAATVAKPVGVSHEDAAGVLFGGSTALDYLRHKAGGVQPGHRVLIVGASGAVGTNAVQLAARAGAEVTGVCSGANASLVRSLGAAQIIDHTVTDLASVTGDFDIVLDAVGVLGRGDTDRLLAPDGRLLLAAASLGQTVFARGRVKAGPAKESAETFAELLDLVADGSLTVVTDQVRPLAEITDAYRRVDSGRKVGNVIVIP